MPSLCPRLPVDSCFRPRHFFMPGAGTAVVAVAWQPRRREKGCWRPRLAIAWRSAGLMLLAMAAVVTMAATAAAAVAAVNAVVNATRSADSVLPF